jgi:predicted Zn-dependent peptidase
LSYAEAFHYSYADSGLFGIFAHAESGNAARVAESLAKQFQTLSVVTEAEVARAKLQLKLNLYNTFSSDPNALAEFYASQASASSSILTPAQFAAQIDSIDTAAVVAVAKKIAASKLTVAALGDVKGLPKF